MTRKIAIIGAGVIALTTGIRLLEKGFDVTLFHDPDATMSSYSAVAIWMPYKAFPEERILAWAKRSYDIYRQLPSSAGISLTEYRELHLQKNERYAWTMLAHEYRNLIPEELPGAYKSGFSVQLFRIDTLIFMKFLLAWYAQLGGKTHIQKLEKITDIHPKFQTIINCSGLGAKQLVPDDTCYPIRGQYLIVEKPTHLKTITFGVIDKESYTLVAPRTHDCYLGGTTQYHNWDTAVNEETSQRIFEHAQLLEPALKNSRILKAGVGLRPGRNAVRLEWEKSNDRRDIIHNYGHGGSGFTVCWSCAEEVVALIQKQS